MSKAKRRRTLQEFELDRRREEVIKECRVCALPEEVRKQLRALRNLRISKAVAVQWLSEDYGIKLTEAELMGHSKGQHDERRKAAEARAAADSPDA